MFTSLNNVEQLSGRDFKQKFEKSSNSVLLDVRTPGEFSSGSLPNARNIDYLSGRFEAEINKLDKTKEYFVFCRSGARSAQACQILHSIGIQCYNLQGGIGQWPH